MMKIWMFTLVVMVTRLGVAADVKITSVEQLRVYAARSGNTVTMEAGTYQIAQTDRPDVKGAPAIDFTGDGNTFDFTGVTLEVDNRYYNATTYRNLLRVAGNNNLFKNLVIRDIGSLHTEGGLLLVFGGVSNTVDGFSFFPKGSTPYGYGSLFGKGDNTLAFLTSTGIDLTLVSLGAETHGADIPIVFAGTDMSVRHGEWMVDTASRNKLVNSTSHPVILREKASDNIVESVGPVTDHGRGNETREIQVNMNSEAGDGHHL